jgi:LysR family glycine cleavage system transcriptional activator
MRHRLPPLSALPLFEAAARHLSFKSAADELLLTPSAVSHGIQSLEKWLNTPLFTRTPKGLLLTEAGASYYPLVQSALQTLADGSQRISARPDRQRLRISAAPTFATRMLMPALGEFQDAHPSILVEVDTSQDCVTLGDGADVAIRVGKGRWPDAIVQELLRETLVPVCAPARRREFAGMSLDELPLIHVTTVSEDWARWAAVTGRKIPAAHRGIRFDTLHMAFAAAARGLGVAIGRRPLVDAEIASGTLVPLWGDEVPCESAHWLLTRAEDASDGNPAVATFCTWLKARPLNRYISVSAQVG